jgi:pilus assembly protein CpaE
VGTVLISTDGDFRSELRQVFQGPGLQVELRLELEEPFTGIGDPELARIREADPGLIVVDLESDPHIGLKFIQYLVESGSAPAVIAAGRDLSPELLLQAMQAGVTELLTKPVTPEQVESALQRVWKKTGRKVQQAEERNEPGRTISIFGTKGGAGTTSLATNLAIEIHRMTRKRVLLLDLDVELGETALMLGMDPQFSLMDLTRNFHRVDAGLLASYIEHHESGIDLLAAPFQPADYETVSRDRIRQVIRFLKGQYDYVIMDTPKSFHPASIGTLEEADEIYLLTTPTLPAIRNLVRSLPLIRQIVGPERVPSIKLVVNRYQPGSLISIKEIEETVGLQVLHWIRNDFEAVMGGINEGKPAVLRGVSQYAKGVRQLAGIITGTRIQEEAKKGLLSGFVGALKTGK